VSQAQENQPLLKLLLDLLNHQQEKLNIIISHFITQKENTKSLRAEDKYK